MRFIDQQRKKGARPCRSFCDDWLAKARHSPGGTRRQRGRSQPRKPCPKKVPDVQWIDSSQNLQLSYSYKCLSKRCFP